MRRFLLALLVVVLFPASASAAPIRGAWYYPWFGSGGGNTTFGHYTPSLGFYDSGNPSIQKYHVRAMQREHIKFGISSWWGQGTLTDQRFPELLRATRLYALKGRLALKWTPYYEPEGYGDPTVAQIQADLAYLRQNYAGRREFFRQSDKPVIFVWASGSDGCAMADRWKQAAPDWYVVLKLFPGYTTCLNQPDSWHQYGPDVAAQQHVPYSYVISPGFYAWNESVPRLVRDSVRWRQNIRDCIAAAVKWCLITTFNEWGEGTAVESGTEWTSGTLLGKYGDALANDGREPPPSPSDPVITAAGDISCPSTSCSDDETASLLEGTALTLGDNQYDSGTQTEYTSYESWPHTAKSAPGNHDPCPSSYYDEWFTPPGCWYSFDLGTWHLISLDSNRPTDSTQLSWLTNDLATHPNACVLAYWHHPRYSSGNYSPGVAGVQPFLDRLVGRVDLVLNGHDHNYERFGIRDGYRQFIVGTGGRSHYGQGTAQPFSEARNSTTYGVLRLTLHPASYDWQFKPIAGQTFTDTGSDVCR